jgi:hypothetical protein
MDALGITCGVAGLLLGLYLPLRKARQEYGRAGVRELCKLLARDLGAQEGVERDLNRRSGNAAFWLMMLGIGVCMIVQGTGAAQHVSIYIPWGIGWLSYAVVQPLLKRRY